jgi:hypothetical protein
VSTEAEVFVGFPLAETNLKSLHPGHAVKSL